jgi:hypothetical protein
MKTLSRRDFLNLSSLSFGALAIRPLHALLPPEDRGEPIGIGRVTIREIGVFREPDLKSDRIGSRKRDELVSLYGIEWSVGIVIAPIYSASSLPI